MSPYKVIEQYELPNRNRKTKNDTTESTLPLIDQSRGEDTISPPKSPVALLRKAIWLGFATAVTVLMVNVATLVYAVSRSGNIRSNATVYDGSCDTTKRISSGLHVLINILSTLLLGASNQVAQYIGSPTRAEVDAAHRKSSWMDIGIPSLRNLRSISSVRVILWVVLMCSSFPLHSV